MEEKILNILMSMQKDISELKGDVKGLKEDVSGLKGDVKELKEGQRIMKLNLATILEKQNEMNENFKKHEREANIRYKELDYRLSLLEA